MQLFDTAAKVKDVGKIDCVLSADQVAGHKASRTQDHGDSVKVGLVDEAQEFLVLSLAERRLGDGILILPGLEVAPGEQRHEVG